MHRRSLVPALLAAALCALAAAPPAAGGGAPGPDAMADTGGGSQVITAVAADTGATRGTVTWWERADGRWRERGSAPARFGSGGLVEGATRRQGTGTTPTGIFPLPYAFGTEPAPRGTSLAYRAVEHDSWWCEDSASRAYNRWVQPLPADCRAEESEHLADYRTPYAYAMVVGYNYERPVRGRGAGIFLHVNGSGPTAGCVSVPADAMRRLLAWARPERRPHLAVGTAGGRTALTRY
ncbi:L,D-transpeptidase [Streptomyces sp. NPDC050560]|uniref:L,D-transpeptidase n=1 Tax=Streptomyces sp. NPDC050560 TaxID=3365630 RepID=UPI0037B00EBA